MTARSRADLRIDSMKGFNDFNSRFRQLERRSGNDPSRIEWLVKNSPDARRLVGSLYFWERKFEAELAKHRFLRNVPGWFRERYKVYRERYGPEVTKVYGFLTLCALEDDEVDGIPATEILHPDGPPAINEDEPDELSGWFVPGYGAQSVDFMIRWLWNMHDGYDSSADLRAGLDAWDWFTETVGIDLSRIEERWEKLPRVLIPTHAETSERVSGRNALTDLLDEATKAYVFGLPAAGIAMCRAVCERVLKEFYLDDHREDETLGNLAYIAEKRFGHIKRIKLGEYIRRANKVMHDYQGGQLTEDQLQLLRQFLEMTKSLVEQAPRR